MTRRGHAAVEFALVFPVLLVLLIAAVEWGTFLQRRMELAHVVRDAAAAGSRIRSQDLPAVGAEARAMVALESSGFDTDTAEVTVTPGTAVAGTTLSVAIAVPYAPISGLLPMPSQIRSSITLRMQSR